MTTPSTSPSATPPLALAKRLTLASLVGLIALYIVSSLLEEQIFWTLLIVPCLSLLIFVPGMLKSHARSFDWLCFVILIHFVVGVTNSMSPAAAWNDYLQTVLTVVLFISSMMASRWQKAANHQSV
ncbi:DUF2069 domain-containing protein [Aestuariicella sp. G3-2]|uniref:DUF2069 domain-containing protein n=1 Tax=Pseudomaricurvus albidus TaxID=2842452 RepID=UPI001C0C0D36|nr:DUF2069 domain-containing protein [Aestuariicella albida]MBU3069595.1 DUF2069 domain-containing protein [Aestuariicella albida]